MDDDVWIDISRLGSIYEEQRSRSGRWRHRQRRLICPPDAATNEKCMGFDDPWVPGRAPDWLQEGQPD